MTDDRRQLTACYPEVITRALICTVLPLLSTLACKAVTAKTPHVRRLAKMECISLDALASRGHTDAETPTRHTLCKRNSRCPQLAAMEREGHAQCSCYHLHQAGQLQHNALTPGVKGRHNHMLSTRTCSQLTQSCSLTTTAPQTSYSIGLDMPLSFYIDNTIVWRHEGLRASVECSLLIKGA
jgi:hypothetical protein